MKSKYRCKLDNNVDFPQLYAAQNILKSNKQKQFLPHDMNKNKTTVFLLIAIRPTHLTAQSVPRFQITSGYFTWSDGPPTLSNVDIRIPFGEYQAFLLLLLLLCAS